MKSVIKFIVALAGLMFLILMSGIIYFYFYAMPLFNTETRILYHLLIFLLVLLTATCGIVTAYASIYLYRQKVELQSDISKAVLISESNAMIREYPLIGKESALIGKSEYAFIDLKEEGESHLIGYEHAVINRISQNWFVENISEEYILGLKRSEGQYVYKLKTGVCYKLYVNDVLYISNIRLLFI